MVCAPFQCDRCWFVNLHKREPNDLSLSDIRLQSYIRRVNLDVFWCREPSTVKTTLAVLEKGKRMSRELGLPPIRIPIGSWPVGDTCGFQVAIEMLKASQRPGKNASSYTQFDSIRKIRTGYLNAYEAGPARCLNNSVFKSNKGQMFAMIGGATQSKLFSMFLMGCEKRMGRVVKQDLGISFEMIQGLLRLYEGDLSEEGIREERKRMIIVAGSCFVILWAGALRGNEMFMLEAGEFVKRRDDGRLLEKNGHCVIPLMGRFKNETGERNLLMVLANKTRSGLRIRHWVDKLSELLKSEGRGLEPGPAVCNPDGYCMESWRLNEELHSVLERLRDESPLIIPSDIVISESFNIRRSFRRGATTRAKEQGVNETTIELNNRWRKVQNSQGNVPRLPMSQLYTEITQALTSKLRFSNSL